VYNLSAGSWTSSNPPPKSLLFCTQDTDFFRTCEWITQRLAIAQIEIGLFFLYFSSGQSF